MRAAWETTERQPLEKVEFRVAEMSLPARRGEGFTIEALQETLADPKAGRCSRIMAALALSWRQRVDSGQPVDVPCLDLASGVGELRSNDKCERKP